MNKHKAIVKLMKISAFLQKLEPLMSPTIHGCILGIDEIVHWLESLPDEPKM